MDGGKESTVSPYRTKVRGDEKIDIISRSNLSNNFYSLVKKLTTILTEGKCTHT